MNIFAHIYLIGQRFLLVTDHRALLWLVNTPNPPATMVRWLLRLGEYDFSVEHRPGKLHNNVDALSRPPFVSRTHTVNLVNTVEPLVSKYAPKHNTKELSTNDQIPINFVEHIALQGFTNEQLRKLQKDDKTLVPFFDFIEKQELPVEISRRRYVILLKELLHIEHVILWHRYLEPITPMPTSDIVYQVVIPTGLRTAVLQACHNEVLSGHLGFNKTYNKIKTRFWWPNLYTEVYKYVLGCQTCQQRKNPRTNLQGVLQPSLIYRPWERMSMDLLGPLPETKAGNKYLLVCNDHFTRWVEAFALKEISMPTIENTIIIRIICRFGCPEQILTDRGSNFLSNVGQLLYKALRSRR